VRLQAIPIRSSRKNGPFPLVESMLEDMTRADLRLFEGDIVVISSKYVSLAEGRLYKLSDVQTTYQGEKYVDRFAELVYRESEQVVGSFLNFHLSITNNVLAPNSGIDGSNTRSGFVTLYPINPNLLAEKIRISVLLRLGIYIGIILTDSRLYPLRQGTTGIAIGFSGVKAIVFWR
jgi:F420-0:gamma-glutamyl ligase